MTVWALVAAVALLLANAVFVAAEFAFIAARRTRLEQLAEDGDRRAAAALGTVRELNFTLSGAQLGITMASLALGAVGEPAVAGLLEAPLGVFLPEAAVHGVAVVVALALVVFLHMVLGEMVPKNIAIAAPERSALLLALPMRAYTTVFRPAIRLLTALANAGLRLVGVEPRTELATAHTAEELAAMLAVSRREGLVEEFEHRLLSGALGFPQRTVGSVMVPRERVVAVGAGSTAAAVERVVLDSGHSRLPVHGVSPDDVLGFVHAKDLLTVEPAARSRPLPPRLLRRMLVVDADRTLGQLLLAMQRNRLHFALVREDGRTVGIVTLEDVLEELVGDIRDEHDRAAGSATTRSPRRPGGRGPGGGP